GRARTAATHCAAGRPGPGSSQAPSFRPAVAMVAFTKRPVTENGLDARIAALSRRAQPLVGSSGPVTPPAPIRDLALPPAPDPAPALPALLEVSEEDRLLLVREELFGRLTAELSSERISILSRGELAKVVDAAAPPSFPPP